MVSQILESACSLWRRLYEREFLFVSIVLLALESMFFYREVFQGQAMVATGVLYGLPPWSASPPGPPISSWASDAVFQFQVWRQFAAESLRRGIFPLWNPYNYAGAPFLGNIQTALFFPLTLLYYILPYHVAETTAILAKLYVAGISTYYFAKSLRLSRYGALISAITFAFCGFLIVWLDYAFTNSAILLPLLFLIVFRLHEKPNARRYVALSIVVAIQVLGGGIEITAFSFAAASLFYLTLLLMDLYKKRSLRTFVDCVRQACLGMLAYLVGLAASAVVLLPFIETLLNSYIWVIHAAHGGGSPWQNVVSLLMPNFWGTSGSTYWGIAYANFPETNGGYVGPVAIVLAVVALAASSKRIQSVFFGLLASLSMLVIYDSPYSIYSLIKSEILTTTSNGRLLLVLAFSLAILAGHGADALDRRKRVNFQAVAIAIGLLILVALSAVMVLLFGSLSLMSLDKTLLLSVLVTTVSGFLLFSSAALVTFAICRFFNASRSALTLVPKLLLVAILVASLFSLTINYNLTERTAEYPSAPAISFLEQDRSLFRILSEGYVMLPESNMPFKIFSIRGYDTLPPDPFTYLEARTGSVQAIINVQFFKSYDSPALNIMNVKYLIADRGFSLPTPRFQSVYNDSAVEIFLNREYLPRVFLVYNYTLAKNETTALQQVAEAEFDYAHSVLLGPLSDEERLPRVDPGEGTVVVRSYDLNDVVIDVGTSSYCLLFISDAWYPGWSAHVDGSEVQIYRADYAFRAVAVPPGQHVVTFSYRPLSFEIGVLVSASVSFCLIAILIATYWRGTKKYPKDADVVRGKCE